MHPRQEKALPEQGFPVRLRVCSVAVRVEQRRVPVEREVQQVDYPERRVVRAEDRMEVRVADDRELAALDRAVERLGRDPCADGVQLALVELGLAQDVEPQRRVVEQRIELRRVQRGEARAAVSVLDLRLRQL